MMGLGGFGESSVMLGLGGFGMLLWLVVWVGLVALVLWGVGALFRARAPAPDRELTALEVLRRRFASGEITQEEYEQARRVLG